MERSEVETGEGAGIERRFGQRQDCADALGSQKPQIVIERVAHICVQLWAFAALGGSACAP